MQEKLEKVISHLIGLDLVIAFFIGSIYSYFHYIQNSLC